MARNRREFLRLLGMGVAGATCACPVAAWAERVRILGGGEGPEQALQASGVLNPEFQRFVAGLRVGEVKSHGGLRVFWLHGGPLGPPLPIATLEEARAGGNFVITERDQASVPDLVVENRGKSHVLLMAGEILLGGKQNRVLTEDILLPPLSGSRQVAVYCVEQGRWAGRGKDFDVKGSFAAPRLRAKVMQRAGQSRVWSEVDRYTRKMEAPSATQSYQEIYEKKDVQRYFDGMVKHLNHGSPPGALGAAAFVGQAMVGLDFFFDPGLFSREWPKLLRAHALEAYRHQAQLDADERGPRARVEEILRAAAKSEGDLRTNAGTGQLFEFRLEALRGSALLFERRVIHAAIL
jgi:hypothetical protein